MATAGARKRRREASPPAARRAAAVRVPGAFWLLKRLPLCVFQQYFMPCLFQPRVSRPCCDDFVLLLIELTARTDWAVCTSTGCVRACTRSGRGWRSRLRFELCANENSPSTRSRVDAVSAAFAHARKFSTQLFVFAHDNVPTRPVRRHAQPHQFLHAALRALGDGPFTVMPLHMRPALFMQLPAAPRNVRNVLDLIHVPNPAGAGRRDALETLLRAPVRCFGPVRVSARHESATSTALVADDMISVTYRGVVGDADAFAFVGFGTFTFDVIDFDVLHEDDAALPARAQRLVWALQHVTKNQEDCAVLLDSHIRMTFAGFAEPVDDDDDVRELRPVDLLAASSLPHAFAYQCGVSADEFMSWLRGRPVHVQPPPRHVVNMLQHLCAK